MEHRVSRVCRMVSTLLITTAVGCAGGPDIEGPGRPVGGLVAVAHHPANLIDCDDFPSPEPDPESDFVVVTVPVDVDSGGGVERVGTPRTRRTDGNQRVIGRAASLARSCVFEPATRDGVPVPDRVEVQFRLSLRG